ncbi:hypothetical protein ACLNGM_11275 [Aureimonas phyllosphaerae]|uniref:hypothetical protein n=1 Tax=Aureimonas phyllosphaerae TaxID=1166078 RepID=UPI003A5BA328
MPNKRQTRRYRKLTPAEWLEIDDAWASGSATLVELSETYDVAIRTLQNHFAARGIMKGAPAGGFDLDVPTLDHLPAQAAPASGEDIATVAAEVRTRTAANAQELGQRLMSAVRGLATDTTVRPAAMIRSLVAAASALERLHIIEDKALGLSAADHLTRELPTLTLVDITADEITAIQNGSVFEEEGELVELSAA